MISYVSVLEPSLQAQSYKAKDTMECFHCGKSTLFGRSHTHHRGVAGGRWKKRAPKTQRIFKANLQTVTILEMGVRKQVKVSTKALKRIKKDFAEGKKPALNLAIFSKPVATQA